MNKEEELMPKRPLQLVDVLTQYLWATKRSKQDLADEIGIPVTDLNRFLNATRTPNGNTLAAIQRWLLREVPE